MTQLFQWINGKFQNGEQKVEEEKPAVNYCPHKWSLPKQMIDGERIFIGRRCKLCGKVE